jgi:hypothetical protein
LAELIVVEMALGLSMVYQQFQAEDRLASTIPLPSADTYTEMPEGLPEVEVVNPSEGWSLACSGLLRYSVLGRLAGPRDVGMATASRIARINRTTMSSIRVNPESASSWCAGSETPTMLASSRNAGSREPSGEPQH